MLLEWMLMLLISAAITVILMHRILIKKAALRLIYILKSQQAETTQTLGVVVCVNVLGLAGELEKTSGLSKGGRHFRFLKI